MLDVHDVIVCHSVFYPRLLWEFSPPILGKDDSHDFTKKAKGQRGFSLFKMEIFRFNLFQISLPDAITSSHLLTFRSMVPVLRFQQASGFLSWCFLDQLDEPKVSERENFLGEIPVWGCFDENCDTSTFERVSLKKTPCFWNVFFKTTKNQWKRRVVIFPRQMPYHSFRKSLGGNRLVRKHPSKFEEWSWIPKNGAGNPRRYLWTNCRCHFPVYLVEVRRV